MHIYTSYISIVYVRARNLGPACVCDTQDSSSASMAKVTPAGSRRRRVCVYIAFDGGDFTLDVVASDTFGNVRTKLQGITGIPPDQQTLRIVERDLYVDHPEEDGRTLADYNIEAFVHIELGHS